MATSNIVLLEYFCTDDVTFVFGVRADWSEPKVVEIKTSLDEIRAFVVEHFGVQTTRESAIASSVYERVRALDLDAFQNFFAPFIEPLRAWADDGDLLWLVPHDVLHYIPLHALRLDGKFLIERHAIFYTPSASVMKYCQVKRTNRPRTNALVFGDSQNNLPFSQQEAQAVASRFGATAYLNRDATKARLDEILEREKDTLDVLHFACHGKFDAAQPLQSGVALAQNGEGDATLTAEEIFGMEFHADLVVLSACESGVNERKPGDELIGLTRALIYAGTPSVLVSLWQVNDLSTTLLMENFYDALARGLTKAEALQHAQLALMKMTRAELIGAIQTRVAQLKPANSQAAKRFEALAYPAVFGMTENNAHPFAHPASWAPFILVGDWK